MILGNTISCTTFKLGRVYFSTNAQTFSPYSCALLSYAVLTSNLDTQQLVKAFPLVLADRLRVKSHLKSE
jgi:hypothetical protein